MTIENAIKKGKKGFYIGHRLILPFRCQLLKIIFDNHIYTQLVNNKDVVIDQGPQNTSIYVLEEGNLRNYIHNYEYIKLIACEMDADLSDPKTHQKVVCKVLDDHMVDINYPDDDVLFIE